MMAVLRRLRPYLVVAIVAAALAVAAYHAISGARRSAFVERSREQTALIVAVVTADRADDRATAVDALRDTDRVDVVIASRDGVTASDARLTIDAVPMSVRLRPRPGVLRVAAARDGLPYLVVGGRTADGGADVFAFYPEDQLDADIAALRPALVAAWLLSVLAIGGTVHLRERRRRRRMAERHERERRFNADMAHELRTPLASMVTAASLIDEAEVPRPLAAPVEVLVMQARRLKALVDDLLELARLEAGDFDPHPELLTPASLAESVIRSNRWQDQVDLIADARPRVRSDRRALARILVNLVANALHHGVGRARVRVSRDGASARIDVIDDGPGIPPGEIDRVFDRFARTGSGDGGGSGLGLAIARENAQMLGGELTVHSSVGIGTRFTLSIPLAQDPTEREGRDPAELRSTTSARQGTA